MEYTYNSVKINYNFYNKGKGLPIVLLHGWGVDSKIFSSLVETFPQRNFLTLDFPPFGESDKNIPDWNIFTYVGMFMSLCDHLHIDKCDILGHSFGGRIAMITSVVKRSLVHSCILVDSAGMKPKRKMKYYMNICKYKLYKKLGKDTTKFGSSDYKSLSPEMKKTFNSIVNLNLEDYAKKMNVKTLLIWGEKDKETPIYMAKRLNKCIKGSTLKIIDGAGHFPFLDCPLEFYKIFDEFLEELWYM